MLTIFKKSFSTQKVFSSPLSVSPPCTFRVKYVKPAALDSVPKEFLALVKKHHVQVGDRVKVDQIVMEVDVFKAIIEERSPVTGTIIDILPKDQEIPDGHVIYTVQGDN